MIEHIPSILYNRKMLFEQFNFFPDWAKLNGVIPENMKYFQQTLWRSFEYLHIIVAIATAKQNQYLPRNNRILSETKNTVWIPWQVKDF